MPCFLIYIQKLANQENLQSSQLKDPENERKQAPKLIVQGMHVVGYKLSLV